MFATKVGLFLCLLVVIVSANPNPKPINIPGGVRPVKNLKPTEALLKNSLSKLAEGGGPHYKVDKVHSATSQVVAGILTRIKADLVNADSGITKLCNVSILGLPSLGNVKVTIACEGEPEVKGTYAG